MSARPTHQIRTMALLLGLTVLGLFLLLPHFSETDWHHPSSSTVTVVRVPNRVPGQQQQRYGNAISLDPGRSSDGTGKMYVDRVHPRHFARSEGSGTMGQAASFAAEVKRMKYEGGEAPAPVGKKCARGSILGNTHCHDNHEDEQYHDDENEEEDDEDYYRKLPIRSPLTWTTHQGPPNKHRPPKKGTTDTGSPFSPNQHGSQKRYCKEADNANSVESTVARTSHTNYTRRSISQEPNQQATQSQQSDPDVVEQTANKNPHTSMNLGIPRPKPSTLTHTSVANIDPSKPTAAVPSDGILQTKSLRQTGDRKALLVHSESTSNQNSQTQREVVSTLSRENKVKIHHSELVPRKLVCDCGPRICDTYPTLCKRWKQVPDRRRSDTDAEPISTPEASHELGDDNGTLDRSFTIPIEEAGNPQQGPSSPTADFPIPLPTTTDPTTTDGIPTDSTTTESTSGEKHYIPPYWRNNGLEDPVDVPKSSDTSQDEIIPPHEKVQDNKNSTYNKPKHSQGPTIADILIPKKCNVTTKAQQRQCGTTHHSGIILYTLVGVFFTCVFLLAVFKCCVCLKKRRNIAPAKKRKSQSLEKSGTSSQGDSLSFKREKQVEGIIDSRSNMGMDGADDSWPRRQPRRSWNFFSRTREVPGRYSPVPQIRAPRIPTLKLPKPVFATVRKVSGLGFEGVTIIYKKSFNKGKKPEINRVKWMSTV